MNKAPLDREARLVDTKHGMAQELHVGYRSPRLFLLIRLLMEEDSNCLRSMRRWARMHRLRLR